MKEHYVYSKKELEEVSKEAKPGDKVYVLMTEKEPEWRWKNGISTFEEWHELSQQRQWELFQLQKTLMGLLEKENKRLKSGDFTEEEFQNLCHSFGEDDYNRFCDGCDEYQKKLFGKCRSDDKDYTR